MPRKNNIVDLYLVKLRFNININTSRLEDCVKDSDKYDEFLNIGTLDIIEDIIDECTSLDNNRFNS